MLALDRGILNLFWNDAELSPEWIAWEANTTTELLNGLVPLSSIQSLASPRGFEPVFFRGFVTGERLV